jgi:outer membrane protein OmpA-like peptidoglycan-associated protein
MNKLVNIIFKTDFFKKIVLNLTLILWCFVGSAQPSEKNSDNVKVNELVKKANMLILYGSSQTSSTLSQEIINKNIFDEKSNANFNGALDFLKEAIALDPDNANINYKLGLCYYFSEDKQLDALPHFQKAIKSLSAKYDFNSIGSPAPYSSLYFLASTYLEANKPDSALKYFTLYKDRSETNAINPDREILMAYNAKESDKRLRNVQVKNISPVINSSYSDRNPVVTINNSLLFFSSARTANSTSNSLSEDIYISKKDGQGKWSSPEAFPYNTEFDEAPVFVTIDGKTLYFKKTIKGNTDIYFCQLVNGVWSQPIAFKEINSDANENGISFTVDGKTLYFSSDKNKAAGRFDLYQCVKDKNGLWGEPKPLPLTINTRFNEVSPFINPDGQTLFFASDGYENKGTGGYDIYYCELNKDKTWSIPQSMGYPINSTRNDLEYYIGGDNKRYYARLNQDKGYDIYSIEGGGFDFESISANMELVTVTNEMGVAQVLETEKEVEKEVEVTKTVETEVEKEKEVEVIKTVETEVEKEKEVEVTKMIDGTNISDVNLENLNANERDALVDKVKSFLSSQLKEKGSVSFKTVYFDINQSNLSLLSINELKLLVEYLNEHPEIKVEVVGNTDNTGLWQTNLSLSNNRAKEVYEFLLRNKVSANRMYYYGRASAVPLVDNSTEENRSKNRRVEVIILK